MTKNKKVKTDSQDFDDLFIQRSGDSPLFTALWFSKHGELDLHFHGYQTASEVLLEYIFKIKGDNTMIYPLVFLIRHAIELGLKESIIRYCKLNSTKPNAYEGIWKSHDLGFLSDKLEEESSKPNSPGVRADPSWNSIKEFLKKWERADKDGSFGRYSRDTDGRPYQVRGNIYAGRITEWGFKTINLLEGTITMLGEYIDIQNTINSEINPY